MRPLPWEIRMFEHVRTSCFPETSGLCEHVTVYLDVVMKSLPFLLVRFPTRELEIRRLFARDEEFRCACDDYETAVKALQHWQHDEENAVRAAEYCQLADEIADEIVARLDATPVPIATK